MRSVIEPTFGTDENDAATVRDLATFLAVANNMSESTPLEKSQFAKEVCIWAIGISNDEPYGRRSGSREEDGSKVEDCHDFPFEVVVRALRNMASALGLRATRTIH
jgi:hypothetical protein